MTPQQLLEVLTNLGVSLSVHQEKLRAHAAPGVLTSELSAQIRDHKAELLVLLQASTQTASNSPREVVPSNVAPQPQPLSMTQIRQAGAARSGSALPIVLRLLGPLDREALQRSLESILSRHALLRSSFQLDVDPPTQLEHDIRSLALEFSDFEAHAQGETAALDLIRELTASPFDVARPPLMRTHLLRMSGEEHWLFTSFSPLVIDGWSFDVFWHELRTAYIALSTNQTNPLPPLELSYVELSRWQNERVKERRAVLEEFWGRELGHQLPPLPLPTDYPRPRLSDHRAGNVVYNLSPETELTLRALARAQGSTPQMVMLTAFYVWLFRLSAESDLVVASPAAARLHPASEAIIGPFVNIMLLRKKIDGNKSFNELLESVRDSCLEAYDHQELPLEQLRVRSSSNSAGAFAPAFQTEFSFQMVNNRNKDMGSLQLVQLELASGAATNDITMWVKDWGTQIKGAVEFKTELFDRSTVNAWVSGFVRVLTALVNQPELPVKNAELMSADELKDLHKRLLSVEAAELSRALELDLNDRRVLNVELVDSEYLPLPLGCFGRLVVGTDGEILEGAKRVRLNHLGKLEREQSQTSRESVVAFRAPQTDLEHRLVQLFSSLLGDSNIGLDHDFFESGGNSLLAVALFNDIARITGVRLPFTAVLEAPTPSLLARRIKEGANLSHASLLRLRQGTSARGVYLIHDGDGETLLYRNLAERLPARLTVYGVNPKPAGSIPSIHTSVEAMAKLYVSEIVRHQPEGPYIIGGLCAGGVVAYEVARIIGQSHARTTLLLLDSAPPFARRKEKAVRYRATQALDLGKALAKGSRSTALRSGLQRLSGGVRYEMSHQVKRAQARLRVETAKRLVENPQSWPQWLDVPRFRDIWNYAEKRYQGQPTDQLDVVLVRATDGSEGDVPSKDIVADPTFDWQQLIQSPISCIDVPGGHSTMLQVPHVDVLSELLNKKLEESAQT